MAATQLATTIDKAVKEAVTDVCQEHGWKLNKFIEEALLDKLEELEDVEDVKSLRKETSRPISDILKDLKAHGKI